MSVAIDAQSSQYLATICHMSMVFCLLWTSDEYVLSSLPPGKPNQEEYDDLGVSFSINLGISLLLLFIEVLLNFRQIPPVSISVFCLFWHTIACVFLLKFTIDFHPIYHFWYAFGVFSVPPFLLNLLVFCASYNTSSFC